MEINPYAAPQDDSPMEPSARRSLRVDGNTLLVPAGTTTLPNICIHTGEVVNGEQIKQRFACCPNWVGFLAVLAPLGLLAYFLSQTSCTIHYSRDPGITRRIRRRRCIVIAVAVVVFGAFWTISDLSPVPTNVVGPLVVTVAILVGFAVPSLRMVGYHDGLFRIKGFSAAFLQRLEDQLDRDEDAPAA